MLFDGKFTTTVLKENEVEKMKLKKLHLFFLLVVFYLMMMMNVAVA